MNKHDPKVKKTLLRNYEHNSRTSKHVTHDVDASSSKFTLEKASRLCQKENLSHPSLCSSELIANYMLDLKQSLPTSSTNVEDGNVDKSQLVAKMTKKLNFHINDKIYRNLIELNTSIEDLKTKKDKRPLSSLHSAKRDLEPNIEDFYYDEKEIDCPPNIPNVEPRFKPVKKVESGDLHQLISLFEDI